MSRYEEVAEAFDTLKKAERIRALDYVVEDGMSISTAAEAIGNSESSVRRHLRDLENAGIIEKEDEYSYTEFGEKIKASLRLLMYEEQMEFLNQSEREIEDLRDDLKRRKKQRIKNKISSLLGM